MKKLLLASFYFSTGETEYSAHRLVAIQSTTQRTDQQDSEEAERVFLKWFPNVYPESKLNHVMVLPAITEGSTYPRIEATVSAGMKSKIITADEAKKLRGELPDAYDTDHLSLDQVAQQIEQTAPYTDRLVLKNLISPKFIFRLEADGFYVNTMIDESAREHYTIISWGARERTALNN